MLASASTAIGYCGAGAVIVAYLLNQNGRIGSGDWRFPAINLVGSLLIVVSLVYHPNLPSVAIEVFWSAISVYGIWRNLRTLRVARR